MRTRDKLFVMGAAAVAALAVGVVASAQNLNVKGTITGEGNTYFLGNVGVGTTSPGQKLDVSGNVNVTGSVYWGGGSGQRTEYKDDAGAIASRSGFFQSSLPVNYYAGASSWQHLIEARHSNEANNYALQIAGSFFDQGLYFRKTNNSPSTPWNKFVYQDSAGNVGIGGKLTVLGAWPQSTVGDGTGDRVVAGTYLGQANFGAHNNALNAWANLIMQLGGGNVGVGTTSPVYKLHVAGDVYANGGWLRTSGSYGWYNESYGGGWNMSDTTWIRSFGGKSVWLDNGLGVLNWLGVGTSAPAQKLQVVGGGAFNLGVVCGNEQCLHFNSAASGWIYAGNTATHYAGIGIAADKLWANGDIYLGAKANWLSALLPNSASTPTFAEVYTNGWFRSNASGTGLYNQVTGTEWYSTENAYWKSSAPYGIQIRSGHEGPIRGYLYADGTNFGLLSPDGSWKVRTYNGGTTVEGDLTVNGTLSGGGGWTKIAELSGYGGQISFYNIPTQYDYLKLEFKLANASTSARWMGISFNGDRSYNYSSIATCGWTNWTNGLSSHFYGVFGVSPPSSSGRWVLGDGMISNVLGEYKQFTTHSAYHNPNVDACNNLGSVQYNGTAKITQIELSSDASTGFAYGSRVVLYGR